MPWRGDTFGLRWGTATNSLRRGAVAASTHLIPDLNAIIGSYGVPNWYLLEEIDCRGRWTRKFAMILNDLLDYLESLPKDLEVEHMFFSSMDDCNQTQFEEKSNHLLLGSRSCSMTCGYSLLHLMCLVVDDHPLLLYWNLRDTSQDDPFSVEYIVSHLKHAEDPFIDAFPIDQTAARQLHGGHGGERKIERTAEQTELWDVAELRRQIQLRVKQDNKSKKRSRRRSQTMQNPAE